MQMSKLEELDLRLTRVSVDALKELQIKRPLLRILY